MNRDDQLRELRMNAASWPPLALVYAALVVGLVLSGMAIT